ncbi:MAG: GNAT family N-acetyltransferase, partial [Rhodospirillales bacterium]|nr:GNAT family N-acetyltransferase [Rhodospirillales bacterium]
MQLTPLPPTALPRALALSSLIGWNQTMADWQVFAEHGAVMACDDGEPELAATVATLHYGPVAWISMVLVRPDLRRQGLARKAIEWAVASLRAA